MRSTDNGHRRSLRLDLAMLLPVAAGVIAFYFWTVMSGSPQAWVSERQGDYYNLLVDGFMDGHLYMKAEPDPALYLPVDKRPADYAWLLDASLYNRHYYLYFGVTPALTVFLPFRLLTGLALNPAMVVALQASAAFLAGLALLLVLRREFAPAASRAVVAACGVAWGLGSGLPVVLRKPDMYEVAATAGMAWSTGCLLFAVLAVLRPAGALRWLALASACAGLAVGARANLLVGVAVLAGMALAWIWGMRRAGRISSRESIGLAAAAGLPAAICGAGLMLYNQLRFDSPFEFGHRYQLGSSHEGFISAGYLWHNLQAYYLTPPECGWFFPYFAQGIEGPRPPGYIGVEPVHGQFYCLVWAAVLAAAVVAALWRAPFQGKALRAAAGILAGWFAGNLAFILCVGARANRYELDFHPALALAGCALFLVASDLPRGWLRRGALAAGWLGTAVVAVFNVGISFQTMELLRTRNPAAYSRLERLADRVVWPVCRLFAPRFGPIAAEVIFPVVPGRGDEPLITAGIRPYANSLMVRYLGYGQAQIQLRNDLYGGPWGPPFDCKPGKLRTLAIWMGSLLPPEGHPWFDGRTAASVQHQKSTVRVTLDGREVFRTGEWAQDASPGQVRLGVLPRWASAPPATFSGSLKRLDWAPPEPVESIPAPGAVWGYRMKLLLPIDRFGSTEPLVTMGAGREGDAILLQYVDRNSVGILHDQVGGGIVSSVVIPADYATAQDFEVLFDPLAIAEGVVRTATVVLVNGRVVLKDTIPNRPFSFGQAAVAVNPMQISSIARAYFCGTVLAVARADRERTAPGIPPGSATRPGPVTRPRERAFRLLLRLPSNRPGRNEPLLSAGKSGAADGLYVMYRSDRTVQIGFDHWGVRGFQSDPVPVADFGIDVLDVRFGGGTWEHGGRGELRVRLNGKEIIRRETEFYGVDPGNVLVGKNPIGFSTSEPEFTGAILSVEDPADDF